jgi:thiamine biosynthesis protein ThiS
MKLTVNGEVREVAASTLAALLAELDYEGNWLATAVNSELVRAADRTECRLKEGDRIEILSPRQGG